jgi:hypothetical protein
MRVMGHVGSSFVGGPGNGSSEGDAQPRSVGCLTRREFSLPEAESLRLAYAQHVYRQQGATVDRSVVLTCGWQTSRETAYVGLEVSVQYERIEVGSIGPYDGAQLVVHAHLCEIAGIGQRLEHGAMQLLVRSTSRVLPSLTPSLSL